MTDATPLLLEVRNLRKSFATRTFGGPGQTVDAVAGVDLSIEPGETVGVVGESGCGKTTLARCLLHLESPTSGEVLFEGRSVPDLTSAELRNFRRQAQIVFQDPFGALDPHFTVERTLMEPMRVHQVVPRGERRSLAISLLRSVGLSEAYLRRHRHQLSGGEAQRVGIARALVTRPRFLVLDEPTSALDASAKALSIDLLAELRRSLGMAYLVISHDLASVRHLCQRILVMYLGRVVESGPTEELFTRPRHPYTEALLSATAVPDPDAPRRSVRLRGELRTAAAAETSGCVLAARCPYAVEECSTTQQVLVPDGQERLVRCHRVSNGDLSLGSLLPVVPASGAAGASSSSPQPQPQEATAHDR